MWDMGHGWGWWMGFGWMWMIGFWALIIWAVFTLTKRGSADKDRVAEDQGTALEIVERRYARGELNDEQYEAMRARLSRPPAPIAA
jgi:putative membrane protein